MSWCALSQKMLADRGAFIPESIVQSHAIKRVFMLLQLVQVTLNKIQLVCKQKNFFRSISILNIFGKHYSHKEVIRFWIL